MSEVEQAESNTVTYRVRQMRKEDIAQVTQIDREAFPTMWPPVNFHHEIDNKLAHYLVAYKEIEEVSQAEVPEPTVSRLPFSLRKLFGGGRQAAVAAEPRTIVTHYVLGFIGIWLMADEAHIINIAVRAQARHLGIGELLLIAGIELAMNLKASMMTLEVRASNATAKSLYAKYSFVEVGVRHGYYTDNKEDAVLMSTENFNSAEYLAKFQPLKEAHLKKLGMTDYR